MATTLLRSATIAETINAALPDAARDDEQGWVELRPERLVEAATLLRDDRDIDARYLIAVSGVDYYDRFEIIYHLASLSHNHEFVLKVNTGHEEPEVPSVAAVWLGAELQEREIFDLLGVRFTDHPDLTRIFLWEGFPGHPLRKDYMSLPGGKSPGLRQFPQEHEDQWGGEFRAD